MFKLLEHNQIGESMDFIYGFLAVGSAGVSIAASSIDVPVVEYGALGLCGYMVFFLCRYVKECHKDHKAEREQALRDFATERNKCMDRMDQITDKQVEAYEKISTELRMRECLLTKTDTVARLESALDRLEREKN